MRWANAPRRDRDDSQRVPIEREDLDLVGSALVVGVHHRSDVARSEVVLGQILGEDHLVMLVDHVSPIRLDSAQAPHQAWQRDGACVDDPYRTDQWIPPVRPSGVCSCPSPTYLVP